MTAYHPKARYSQMLSHLAPSAHLLGAHYSRRAGRIKMAFTTTNPSAIPSRNPCHAIKKPGLTKPCALGYHVGYYGKWHLGHINPEKRGAHGFDPNIEIHSKPYHPQTNDHTYEKTVANYANQTQNLIKGRAPFWGDSPQPKETIQPFPTVNKGVKFLEAWARSHQNKPFFLTVSSSPPHFPHHLPEEYVKLAEELRTRVELPANLNDNCEGRPYFHSTSWWGCMDHLPPRRRRMENRHRLFPRTHHNGR